MVTALFTICRVLYHQTGEYHYIQAARFMQVYIGADDKTTTLTLETICKVASANSFAFWPNEEK